MSSLNAFYPTSLADVWRQIRAEQGEAALLPLRRRLLGWQIRLAAVERVRAVCLIQLEPLCAAGLWVPELTEIAGADLLLSQKGMPPTLLGLQDLHAADPDVLLLALPGQSLPQAMEQARHWVQSTQALGSSKQALRCLENKQFYCLDGSQLVHHAGAGLVDTLETLADLLHPALKLGHEHRYWQRV